MATPFTTRSPQISRTKIVATLGPACGGEDQLAELILAGADVFRLNTAHGDRAEHEGRLAAVHAASRMVGYPVAVLVDLAGPKIRLGELPGGSLQLNAGDPVRFVRGNEPQEDGDLVTTYGPLIDELAPGDRVMLADGTVSLTVETKTADTATCRVVQPGLLRSRQGVNLPGVKLSAPALGEHDRNNAVWAARAGVDFVSLSFVRRAEELETLRSLLRAEGSDAQVVAKIEKPEAIEQLDAIVEASDAVMVARGDLGVEIDIAEVATVQKRIVETCNRCRKPVIIATQMLDSMQHSRTPTRAEVTDVANAVLDGADACMLSGETAMGQYPRLCVEMMHRIALAAEAMLRERPHREQTIVASQAINPITEATVHAAGQLAEELEAKLVVVASASGLTALALAKHHRDVPTVGVSLNESALRRMCLYWGVIPLSGVPATDGRTVLQFATDWGRRHFGLTRGDRVVLLTGTGMAASAHNGIVVHQVE